MTTKPDLSNPDAPFGHDENGTPKAPYGLKVDGKPRTSNRGARAGQRGQSGSRGTKPAGMKASVSSLTDVQRKGILCELAGNLLVTPLATASNAPLLAKKLGPRQADALAGDAFIINAFAPNLADAAIILSKSKPKALAWMDKIEDNAPYVMLAQVGIAMAKAFIDNHMHPNARIAEAGRNLAALRIAEMAEEINRQAAEMQPEAMADAA